MSSSAEFVSGDSNNAQNVTWTSDQSSSHVIHSYHLVSQQDFAELNGYAQDSTSYYSMGSTPGLTWQIGEDVVVRSLFSHDGVLQNSSDIPPRAVSNNWPVFALAADLGTVGSTVSDPVVWSLGIVRNQSINALGESRSAYYWSNFSSPTDVVSRTTYIAVLNTDLTSRWIFLSQISRGPKLPRPHSTRAFVC